MRLCSSFSPLLMLILALFSFSLLAATDTYIFQLETNFDQGVLSASERVEYFNNSSEVLNEIRFRLDFNLNLAESMQILSVKDGKGKELSWHYVSAAFGNLSSEKGQMVVELDRPLEAGGVVEIRIDYQLEGESFLGLDMTVLPDDPYLSFDAWYPKAMTFLAGDWSVDDDRLADYEVAIVIPSELVVASTGTVIEEQQIDDGRTKLLLRTSDVRGFSMYGCRLWEVHHAVFEGVEIRCYITKDQNQWAERFLDAAGEAIAYYSSRYGEYPKDHLSIVCPPTAPGQGSGAFTACNVIGILLGGRLEEQYRWLVAHEVAHQYFSISILQPRDEIPWILVGLGMVMDRHYLLDCGFGDDWHRMMVQFYPRVENEGRDTTLVQPVSDLMRAEPPWSFQWNLALSHGKAFAVCALLEDLLGEERFRGVVQKIISEHAGGMISASDLITYCEEAYGGDLSWFSADWIEGNATLDYAVAGVHNVESGWEVEVSQLGNAAFPVIVEIRTESGDTLRQRVSREEKLTRLSFESEELLTSVVVAPGGIYPDIDPSDNTWLSEKGQPADATEGRTPLLGRIALAAALIGCLLLLVLLGS
jgi:hypothetical protein